MWSLPKPLFYCGFPGSFVVVGLLIHNLLEYTNIYNQKKYAENYVVDNVLSTSVD